jgi:hypothetical protein
MPLADRLYRWLASGPTPDCDEILAAGITHAESPWSEQITRVLLARGHTASWAALIGVLDRTPTDIRAAVLADREKLAAGIVAAMKSPAPAVRINALAAFAERPDPRLMFVLPEALRDPDADVRSAAGSVLRRTAEALLSRGSPAGSFLDERRELVATAREAVRTFDLHHRSETLEVALWLAAEIGPTLWALLENHRSRAGVLVSEHLADWNHPWLAGFLVQALRFAAWRRTALAVLRGWKSRAHLIELLRVTHLLDDPDIVAQLTALSAGPLLAELSEDLSGIPAELESAAPRWAAALGGRTEQRAALLQCWARSTDTALSRAAVYALAAMNGDGPLFAMREIAERSTPLGVFARWWVQAHDAGLVRSAGTSAGATRAEFGCRQRVEPEPEPELEHDFATLWQACRRSAPEERAHLFSQLRKDADVWQRRFRALLHSPDARDRLLMLQLISPPELAVKFRHELRSMLEDPAESVRELTESLLHGFGDSIRVSASHTTSEDAA